MASRPITNQEAIPIYFVSGSDRPISQQEAIPIYIANPNSLLGTGIINLTDLTSITPTTDDTMYIVDAPGTVPVPSKTTVLALGTTIAANVPTNGLMVGSRQLFVVGGRVGIFATGTSTAMLEIDQPSNTGAIPVLALVQRDIDDLFVNFIGTSGSAQNTSISTANGDGVVDGPKIYSSQAGWQFSGMVAVGINGVSMWLPYYTPDIS